jgi:hypothetical protein
MITNPEFYRRLEVSKTFQVTNAQNITDIVTQLADYIEKNHSMDGLRVRILLPRGNGNGYSARKLGVSLRSNLILALRKKRIRPILREVRYVHDEYYYGWILIEPSLLDNLHVR